MKLSNFVFTKVTGEGTIDGVYHAEVDVTTGILWWKNTERKRIRRKFGDFWYFEDSGMNAPPSQVAQLIRVTEVKTGRSLPCG